MALFDAKPELTRWHAQPFPGRVEAHFDTQVKNLLGSPFRFHKRANAAWSFPKSCRTRARSLTS